MTKPHALPANPAAVRDDRAKVTVIRDVRGTWRCRADWSARFRGIEHPDWRRLHDDGRATLVKQGRGRSVWRVAWENHVVYAKIQERGGFLDRIKQWCLGSPARREWDALRAAEARGVPTPPALAWGQLKHDGASVLLTLGIEGTQPLAEAWARARALALAAGERSRAETLCLIRGVAKVFARAHECGAWHRDAHPRNILVRNDGGEVQAWFTDLLGARFRSVSCTIRESLRALVQLDQRMHRAATRAQRLRFLREYLIHRRGDSDIVRADLRGLLREKQRLQEGHAERLARQWDRRLRGDGKYFARVRRPGGWRGIVALRPERPHLFPGEAFPARPVESWRRILDDALTNEDLATRTIGDLCVWSEQARNRKERIAWGFFGSPARRVFHRAHRLRHRDRDAPLYVGYLEHRRGVGIDSCVLLAAAPAENDPTVTSSASAACSARA